MFYNAPLHLTNVTTRILTSCWPAFTVRASASEGEERWGEWKSERWVGEAGRKGVEVKVGVWRQGEDGIFKSVHGRKKELNVYVPVCEYEHMHDGMLNCKPPCAMNQMLKMCMCMRKCVCVCVCGVQWHCNVCKCICLFMLTWTVGARRYKIYTHTYTLTVRVRACYASVLYFCPPPVNDIKADPGERACGGWLVSAWPWL